MKKILAIVLALTLLIAVLPASAFAASSKKIYVSSTGKGTLNLRSGPGYEYASIGYVHHNNKVKVYESSGVWSRIKYGGKTGWIRTMYIDGTTKALGNGYKAIVAPTSVYSSADATSVVGSVSTADTVKVYYTERDFASVHVSDSGLSGWIPISCIGGTVKLTADNPPSGSDVVYRTTATTLNVRSGPGTRYAVVHQLPRNTGCTVLETSGNWYRIKTFGGIVGWVSSNYLKSTSTARVTASALNVRKGPGTSSAILGSLKRGKKVTVKYTSGNWAYITSGSLTGYVSLNYLRF
ncbi:MAG: SH3 domain-containing protein [Clostridia bacterium]|nr:SH3 domain-containing protein [Clostridia bacterium]